MILRLALPGLLCLLVSSAAGQSETPAAKSEAAPEFRAYAAETAASYKLRAESSEGRVLSLRQEPILRWSNPLAGRKAHGDVFLWTDEGRPAAVLSLYEYTTPDGAVHEHHEFCSVATGKLFGEGAGGRIWSPATAGVALLPLDDAPQPADSAVRRLSQMRQLAGRFSGSKVTREERAQRDLRLLTQPIVRYESKFHGVTDGALFALVEATDPEIFLILEARQRGSDLQWHYALARMNSLSLAASYQDKQIWEADVLPWRDVVRSADKPYMLFPIR